MECKGQVELIVIVGLLVVIAAVVVSQMHLFVVPGSTPDVRTARESVEGLLRAAALDTIKTMSDNGGYLSASDYQLGSVTLNGKELPYWQYGGRVTYPDKLANFQAGVQAYLEANKDSLAGTLSNVTLGEPHVLAPVFADDSVTVSVNMPAKYKGTDMAQPFTVTVDTHFSEIYDFSRGFAIYEAENRPFEYYTLSTMLLSPMENGHHSIPMYELLIGCGDYLFASSWDVIPEVEDAITKTLAYTYMPGKAPTGTLRTSSSPKYSLVPINGRDYEDLRISFMLPDDFGLDTTNFRMSPDPATGTAEPIPMMGQCIGTEPVSVDYMIEYPTILRALDPETGSIFQFAFHVFIHDNAPREWSASVTPEDDILAEVCSEPSCTLGLDVLDSSGNPIESASVSFMGCFLGRTDSGGHIATLAPCGSGTLYVYKRGYGEYLDPRTSGHLDGIVTLYKKPAFNLIIHEVKVQDWGEGRYMVYYGEEHIQPVSGKRAWITFRSEQDFTKEYSFYSDGSPVLVSAMPAGMYYASGTLSSPDFQTLHGAFIYSYEIPEGLDLGNLHIYMPTTSALDSITDDTQRMLKIGELSQVLEECGIGPVTSTAYIQESACSVTIT
jgi:hypothetical protein